MNKDKYNVNLYSCVMWFKIMGGWIVVKINVKNYVGLGTIMRINGKLDI